MNWCFVLGVDVKMLDWLAHLETIVWKICPIFKTPKYITFLPLENEGTFVSYLMKPGCFHFFHICILMSVRLHLLIFICIYLIKVIMNNFICCWKTCLSSIILMALRCTKDDKNRKWFYLFALLPERKVPFPWASTIDRTNLFMNSGRTG